MEKEELMIKMFTDGGDFAEYTRDRKAGSQKQMSELATKWYAKQFKGKPSEAKIMGIVNLSHKMSLFNLSQLAKTLDTYGIIDRSTGNRSSNEIDISEVDF